MEYLYASGFCKTSWIISGVCSGGTDFCVIDGMNAINKTIT